jgi:hypothetical protein
MLFYHKKTGKNRVFLSNAGISCGRVRRPGGPARRVLRRRRDGSGRQLHAELDIGITKVLLLSHKQSAYPKTGCP